MKKDFQYPELELLTVTDVIVTSEDPETDIENEYPTPIVP